MDSAEASAQHIPITDTPTDGIDLPPPRSEPEISEATPAETSSPLKRKRADLPTAEPLDELLRRRLCTIKEGDNVLLRLPSDSIKAVVASRSGLVQLGKFGAFPASELLGLHYDITYEIGSSNAAGSSRPVTPVEAEDTEEATSFGQMRGKKSKAGKGKGKEKESGGATKANQNKKPGWDNVLRPLRRQPLIDAVVDDITETNEFIDDLEPDKRTVLSQEEIVALRAQGLSAEEMIQKQMAAHERFELKTDFSKEKWRKRKERK